MPIGPVSRGISASKLEDRADAANVAETTALRERMGQVKDQAEDLMLDAAPLRVDLRGARTQDQEELRLAEVRCVCVSFTVGSRRL